MKKLLLLALLINFFACKESKDKSKVQLATSDTAKKTASQWTEACDCDNLPGWQPENNAAEKLFIGNFKNLLKKTKGGKDIDAVWVNYDQCALSCLTRSEGIDSIKFFIAAFDKDYGNNKFKNYPTIILQIKWKPGYPTNPLLGNKVTADNPYLYYESTKYCPPPDPPCNIETN